MFRILPFCVLAGGMLATPVLSDVVAPGGKVIDCFCTDKTGSRVELGQSICLFVDGRAFMARCEMSLNVPMWRDTGEGCVSAELKNTTKLPTTQEKSELPPI